MGMSSSKSTKSPNVSQQLIQAALFMSFVLLSGLPMKLPFLSPDLILILPAFHCSIAIAYYPAFSIPEGDCLNTREAFCSCNCAQALQAYSFQDISSLLTPNEVVAMALPSLAVLVSAAMPCHCEQGS